MNIPSQIRDITDIEEIEKVPFAQRVSFRSTYEMIRAGAAINPQKVALYFIFSGDAYDKPVEITYEQLVGRIHQTANMLHGAGIGKDDVVAIILPNLPQTHFAIWGGEAAGTICTINPFLGADQTKDILQTVKAKALVCMGPTPLIDTWEKVQTMRPDLPDLKVVFHVMGQTNEQEGVYSFDETLGKYSAQGFDFDRVIAPGDRVSMFHTGGTTGSPKLAQHTHLNEVHDAWVGAIMAGVDNSSVLMCGLPLFHVNAVIVTGLVPFSVGASVVLLTPQGYRDQGVMRNFYKIVEHYKATTFSGVPTLYAGLLQVPVGEADISSLQYAVCGAAAMPVDVFQAYEKLTGIKILEGYGLAEGTCISSVNPRDGERRTGSIGIRLPYEEMKTVIADAEGQAVRDCKVGEIGVVAVRGLNVFAGYLQLEHNAKAWLGDGWFNTSDLGRMDEVGYFWLTGRAKELIIRGGHNIDPAETENALYKHPAVELAAAVGRPDSYAGEIPIAFVSLKQGMSATSEELLAHCQEMVGERAAIPKEVRIIESMPVTTVGKIFKPELRWAATVSVFSKELEAMAEMVEKQEVTCGEDKVFGTLARIKIWPKPQVGEAEVIERVHQLLGLYTVKYALEVQKT